MVWYGEQAAVKMGTALASVSTADTLWEQVSGTDYSGECKEVTINPGEAGVDILNVYGDQLLEEKRPELVTADFTMVFTDVDIWGETGWSSETAPSGFTRYKGTDNTGSRSAKAIVFKLSSSSSTVNVLMNNAYITAQGQITLAADGSAEQTFSAVCKLEDFYVESS